MFNPKIREQALRLWLDGAAVAEIANKLKISVQTVKSWQARYGWVEKRNQAIEESQTDMLEKFGEKITKINFGLLDFVAKTIDYANKIKPQKMRDWSAITSIVLRASQIFHNTQINVDEEVSKQLLDSVVVSGGEQEPRLFEIVD